MTPTLLILGIIFIPALIIYFLKVNAVFVYLTLCLGEVLSFFVGNDKYANNYLTHNQTLNTYLGSNNNLRLVLLVLPAILTIVFMIKTASHKKFSINIISSLAVGILAVYLVVPLLNFDTTVGVLTSTIWQKLTLYQSEIIGISSLFILAMLLLERTKLGSHKFKKH